MLKGGHLRAAAGDGSFLVPSAVVTHRTQEESSSAEARHACTAICCIFPDDSSSRASCFSLSARSCCVCVCASGNALRDTQRVLLHSSTVTQREDKYAHVLPPYLDCLYDAPNDRRDRGWSYRGCRSLRGFAIPTILRTITNRTVRQWSVCSRQENSYVRRTLIPSPFLAEETFSTHSTCKFRIELMFAA